MRGLINWYGGKGKLSKRLLALTPPHYNYVEVFGGGAALLFAKPPCRGTETYNDVDGGLVNLFRVVRDPEKYERFYRLASLTLYSREEFEYCKETWRDCEDDVERAYRWFVVIRMGISGRFGGSWGYNVSTPAFRVRASGYGKTIENLSNVHGRLKRVQIEHRDFRDLIPRHTAPDTLLYCDPPYVLSTRTGSAYHHEMSAEDHRELIAILLEYPQMVMLSGYDNSIYDTLTWHKSTIQTVCHANVKPAGGKASPRVECVWLNPLAWDTLHRSRQLNLF